MTATHIPAPAPVPCRNSNDADIDGELLFDGPHRAARPCRKGGAQLSPFERSYLAIKQDYEDLVLFVRVGNFYNLFEADGAGKFMANSPILRFESATAPANPALLSLKFSVLPHGDCASRRGLGCWSEDVRRFKSQHVQGI